MSLTLGETCIIYIVRLYLYTEYADRNNEITSKSTVRRFHAGARVRVIKPVLIFYRFKNIKYIQIRV